MTFKNEIISDEDRKKFGIEVPIEGIIDRERDLLLISKGNNRRDIEDRNMHFFELYYKGLEKIKITTRFSTIRDQENNLVLIWNIERFTSPVSRNTSNDDIGKILIEAIKEYDLYGQKNTCKKILVNIETLNKAK